MRVEQRALAIVFAIACALLSTRCASSSTAPSSTDSSNCKIVLAPVFVLLSAGAQSSSIKVTTGAGCGWQASSSAGFVSLSGGSGAGSATIGLSVPANGSVSARTATVTVGDQKATVEQLASGF